MGETVFVPTRCTLMRCGMSEPVTKTVCSVTFSFRSGLPLNSFVFAISSRTVQQKGVGMLDLLMIAIIGTAVDARGKAMKIGGFGIGLTVASNILAGGAITGASMNPARSFGPALVQGNWLMHWAYWVAPTAGACVAAVLYERVLLTE